MTVQVGLCRTCSETTLLVFPRDGSYVSSYFHKIGSNNFQFRGGLSYLQSYSEISRNGAIECNGNGNVAFAGFNVNFIRLNES